MLWVLAQGRGHSVSDCPRAWLGLLTPLCPIGDRRDTASPGCSAPLAGIQHRSSGPACRPCCRALPPSPAHSRPSGIRSVCLSAPRGVIFASRFNLAVIYL